MAGAQADVPVNVQMRICVWFYWKLDKVVPIMERDLSAVFGNNALKKS